MMNRIVFLVTLTVASLHLILPTAVSSLHLPDLIDTDNDEDNELDANQAGGGALLSSSSGSRGQHGHGAGGGALRGSTTLAGGGGGGGEDNWVKISQGPAELVVRAVGARVELECEAIGSPAPRVVWIHEGVGGRRTVMQDVSDNFRTNSVNENPSTGLAKVRAKWVIFSAHGSDAGKYTCMARAGAQIASSVTLLTLTEPRTPSTVAMFTQMASASSSHSLRKQPAIVLYNSIYMNEIGSDVILPCKVIVQEGGSSPTITWLDPTEKMIPDFSGSVHRRGERLLTMEDGSLYIKSVRWNDMGPYTCLASNDDGEDHVVSFLYPMLPEK